MHTPSITDKNLRLAVKGNLSTLTNLSWATDSDAIMDTEPYWDGEDDTFTIRSFEGIQACTKLESIHIELLLKCDDLTPLTELPALKSVRLKGVIIAPSDTNKRVVEELQKRGVTVTITSPQKGGFAISPKSVDGSEEYPTELFDISIKPVSAERYIEILNGLFPRLAGVLNNTLHINTEKMKTTQFTFPMVGNPRSTQEPPEKTSIVTHYSEKDGTVKMLTYNCFGSIVKSKNGASTQSVITARVGWIPNETDLIEIVIYASNTPNLPPVEKVTISTQKVTASQRAQVEKLIVEAFG